MTLLQILITINGIKMFKSKYTPISVAWEITLACNMNCMHCGQFAGETRLNELTTKEAFNLCEELQNLNTEIINLTGGEPILRKDWRDIGKKIRDLGMDLSLLTNGLVINKEIVQSTATHKRQRRYLYHASLHICLDLLYRHHIIHGIIERPKIGINLCPHIAWKEPQFFTRFHRRPRHYDPAHIAILQC